MQALGESVVTYVVEPHTLEQTCGFGDTLKDMLLDRLVCGMKDECIQCRLLAVAETWTSRSWR